MYVGPSNEVLCKYGYDLIMMVTKQVLIRSSKLSSFEQSSCVLWTYNASSPEKTTYYQPSSELTLMYAVNCLLWVGW